MSLEAGFFLGGLFCAFLALVWGYIEDRGQRR